LAQLLLHQNGTTRTNTGGSTSVYTYTPHIEALEPLALDIRRYTPIYADIEPLPPPKAPEHLSLSLSLSLFSLSISVSVSLLSLSLSRSLALFLFLSLSLSLSVPPPPSPPFLSLSLDVSHFIRRRSGSLANSLTLLGLWLKANGEQPHSVRPLAKGLTLGNLNFSAGFSSIARAPYIIKI
jgi:hypothetical protein